MWRERRLYEVSSSLVYTCTFFILSFCRYIISMIISRDGGMYSCCYNHYFNGSTCVRKWFLFLPCHWNNVSFNCMVLMKTKSWKQKPQTNTISTFFFNSQKYCFVYYFNKTIIKYHLLECLDGFYGNECSKKCNNGLYGERCGNICNCSAVQFCHHITGCIVGKYFILIFSLVSDSKCFFLVIKDQ